MKRAVAHIVAATVFAASSAVVGGTLTVFAKDNPGNHRGQVNNPGNHYGQVSNPGHHYGQLKHHQTPPPSPSPNPAPTPNPTHKPPGTSPSHVVPQGQGATSSETISAPAGVPDLTVVLPAHDQTASRSAADPLPADAWWWMVLLILPALMVIWLIAAAGIARKASFGRQAMPVAALAGAPTV